MTTAVAQTVDQLPVAPYASESAAILNVIERMALNPDIDPDRIERFLNLKKSMDADTARRAFDEAVSLSKAQIPAIVKNRKGHSGKYADFAAIAKEVDPIITQFGLSYRFRTKQEDRILVTCILAHKAGHSEETTLAGPPDTSGNKNAIQAIGSTLSYLQRYTLVQALGIAISEEDDDGRAAGAGVAINEQQRKVLSDLLDQTGADEARFRAFFGIEYLAELPAARFAEAKRLLEAKRK